MPNASGNFWLSMWVPIFVSFFICFSPKFLTVYNFKWTLHLYQIGIHILPNIFFLPVEPLHSGKGTENKQTWWRFGNVVCYCTGYRALLARKSITTVFIAFSFQLIYIRSSRCQPYPGWVKWMRHTLWSLLSIEGLKDTK